MKPNANFNCEAITRKFISNLTEIFLSENSSEEKNSKITFITSEFISAIFFDLEKIYTNGKEGALFCFAENLIKFFTSFISEDAIDNLLEINPNVFEEMMENGIDLHEENLKKNTNRCDKEYVNFSYL